MNAEVGASDRTARAAGVRCDAAQSRMLRSVKRSTKLVRAPRRPGFCVAPSGSICWWKTSRRGDERQLRMEFFRRAAQWAVVHRR